MRKKTRIKDIAKKAGVSVTTVSAVLNNKAESFRINKDTIKKVQSVIEECAYTPNATAASLRLGQTNMLGLILPDFLHWGFSKLANELELICQQNNTQLIIASHHDLQKNEKIVIDSMLSRRVDGLMAISSLSDYSYYEKLQKQGIATILLDRCSEKGIFPAIIGDDTKAVYELLNMQKHRGGKKFAYLGGKLGLSTTNLRNHAVEVWARENELDMIILNKGYEMQDGRELAKSLFHNSDVDAILCGSFTILEGFLRYVSENHMDISNCTLATIGDHKLLDLMHSNIISAKQDYQKMARIAFDMFKNYQTQPKETVILEREIISRQ